MSSFTGGTGGNGSILPKRSDLARTSRSGSHRASSQLPRKPLAIQPSNELSPLSQQEADFDHLVGVSEPLKSFLKSLSPSLQRFIRIKHLNRMQLECFDACKDPHQDMCIRAPTGTGKTDTAKIKMAALLNSNIGKPYHHQKIVVYTAPTRSIISEKADDFRLSQGENSPTFCMEFTGDTQTPTAALFNAQIIPATVEKIYQALTGKHREQYRQIFARSGLLVLDEAQSAGSGQRGITFEMLVTLVKEVAPGCTIQAISGTLTEVSVRTIGRWIHSRLAGQVGGRPPVYMRWFDDTYRDFKLHVSVWPVAPLAREKPANYNLRLADAVVDAVRQHVKKGDKTKLIGFCPTIEITKHCARSLMSALMDEKISLVWDAPGLQDSSDIGFGSQLDDMPDAKPYHTPDAMGNAGITTHHSQLSRGQRKRREEAFCALDVSIMLATLTLSMGVNLSCTLVFVIGTRLYNPVTKLWEDYDDEIMLQMFGRSGRPDTKQDGHVVVMCLPERADHYRGLLENKKDIASAFSHAKVGDFVQLLIMLGISQTKASLFDACKTTLFWITLPNAEVAVQDHLDDLVQSAYVAIDESGGLTLLPAGLLLRDSGFSKQDIEGFRRLEAKMDGIDWSREEMEVGLRQELFYRIIEHRQWAAGSCVEVMPDNIRELYTPYISSFPFEFDTEHDITACSAMSAVVQLVMTGVILPLSPVQRKKVELFIWALVKTARRIQAVGKILRLPKVLDSASELIGCFIQRALPATTMELAQIGKLYKSFYQTLFAHEQTIYSALHNIETIRESHVADESFSKKLELFQQHGQCLPQWEFGFNIQQIDTNDQKIVWIAFLELSRLVSSGLLQSDLEWIRCSTATGHLLHLSVLTEDSNGRFVDWFKVELRDLFQNGPIRWAIRIANPLTTDKLTVRVRIDEMVGLHTSDTISRETDENAIVRRTGALGYRVFRSWTEAADGEKDNPEGTADVS